MPRGVGAAAWIALALVAASCGREHGCRSGETTYETLDGKVKLELVRDTQWSGNHLIAAPRSSFALRVHTTPSFDVPVPCPAIDMAENDAGTVAAFRCRGAGEWTAVRLRGAARHLVECRAPVGQGATPTLDALPPVREAVDRMLACDSSWREIVRAIGEDDGGEAAAATVVRLFAREPAGRRDPWDEAFAVLDDAGKARARAAVCPTLGDAKSADHAYLRAVRHCPIDGAEVTRAAVGRFDGWLRACAHATDADLWAARIAIRGDAREAGRVACAALGRLELEPCRALAHAAIARGATACPAVTAALDARPCDASYSCGRAPCTAAELAAELGAWTDGLVEGGRAARGDVIDPGEGRALLAAAHAQGPLPRGFLLRDGRRRYARPAIEKPACVDPVPRGTPCACAGLEGGDALCRIAPTATTAHVGPCAIRLDDARRAVTEVVRHCVAEGEELEGTEVCCPELTTEAEGQVVRCRPFPAVRAEAGAPDAKAPGASP